MDVEPAWNVDFLDLIDLLLTEQVEFVIVGAFALAQHGLPRATGDLDVFIRPEPDNAKRAHRALLAFGAPLAAASVTADDFCRPGAVYQIGLPPRRIDILTALSGLTADHIVASQVTRSVSARKLPFLGLQALVTNKRSTGRPKDLADVARIEALVRQVGE